MLAAARGRRRPARWLLPALGIALAVAFAAGVAAESQIGQWPGERTREDGLDGSCPAVPELAAIGGMGLSAAVRSFRIVDHLDGLARCLGALSGLALRRKHIHSAAWLIGAAAAARDRTGLTPWPAATEAERRIIESARALLPSGEFAEQVTSGRAQTIEDALTQAPLALEIGRLTWL
jgi:hypothetical protein